MLSKSEENYLKAIYSISINTNKSVSTNQIANKLETKASSVTDMIKKLSDKGFVDYKKYQGTTLTVAGKNIAVKTLRSHRLWELFLVNNLGYNWDEVHELAEQLEHVKSNSLVDRLDRFLEFPSHDPHGDPIPDKYGNIEHHKNVMLSSIKKNDSCIIIGVKDSSSAFLKFLDNSKIKLDCLIKVIAKEEYDNSMIIQINESLLSISDQVSRNLYVKKYTLS